MEPDTKINRKILITALITVIVSEYLLVKCLGYFSISIYPKTMIIRSVQLMLLMSLAHYSDNGLSCIGLSLSTLKKGFLKGCLWAASFGCITALLFGVAFLFGINPFAFFSSGGKPDLSIVMWHLGVGCIIGPIVEEVFFRGYLYSFFRQWGILFGVVVTTGIFAVLHLHISGIPYIQMIGGLAFAISYEIEGSLIVPIIIHVSGNIALYTLSLI